VKRDDQTDGIAAAMAPVETGDRRESFPVVECSSDDHANNDLADPPDGDLADGHASRMTVCVITAAGTLTATVDSGDASIWVG
jgi:hypothetical protein